MAYTIVLSGPGGFRAQAVAALEGEGFVVTDADHGHGLPDSVSGVLDPSAGWITARGDDVSGAHAAVEPLGWQIRSHWGETLKTAPLIHEAEAEHEKYLRDLIRDEVRQIREGAK